MRSLRFEIGIGGLLTLICAGVLGNSPKKGLWHAYHHRYEIVHHGQVKYRAIVIAPALVGRSLVNIPDPSPSAADHALKTNRAQTQRLLERLYDFVISEYTERKLITKETGPAFFEEMKQIKDGMWPIILITTPEDPETILHMVAVAYDWDGQGLPFQLRVFRSGFQGTQHSMPSKHLTLMHPNYPTDFLDDELRRTVPFVRHDSIEDLGTTVHLLSVLRSVLPRVSGEFAEIKTYLSNSQTNAHLGKVIHQILTAFELHRYSITPIPDDLFDQLDHLLRNKWLNRVIDSFCDTFQASSIELVTEEIRACWKAWVLTNSVENSHLFGEANTASRIRVYSGIYGVPPLWIFPDRDFEGKPTGIFKMTLDEFEIIPRSLSRFPMYNELDGSELRRDSHPGCAHLVSRGGILKNIHLYPMGIGPFFRTPDGLLYR